MPNFVSFVASIAELALGEKMRTRSFNHSVTHPAYLMTRDPSFRFGKYQSELLSLPFPSLDTPLLSFPLLSLPSMFPLFIFPFLPLMTELGGLTDKIMAANDFAAFCALKRNQICCSARSVHELRNFHVALHNFEIGHAQFANS